MVAGHYTPDDDITEGHLGRELGSYRPVGTQSRLGSSTLGPQCQPLNLLDTVILQVGALTSWHPRIQDPPVCHTAAQPPVFIFTRERPVPPFSLTAARVISLGDIFYVVLPASW